MTPKPNKLSKEKFHGVRYMPIATLIVPEVIVLITNVLVSVIVVSVEL